MLFTSGAAQCSSGRGEGRHLSVYAMGKLSVFRSFLSLEALCLGSHFIRKMFSLEVSGPLPGWLLSGWVNCLPFQTAMRLWDYAFYERSSAVFFR